MDFLEFVEAYVWPAISIISLVGLVMLISVAILADKPTTYYYLDMSASPGVVCLKGYTEWSSDNNVYCTDSIYTALDVMNGANAALKAARAK